MQRAFYCALKQSFYAQMPPLVLGRHSVDVQNLTYKAHLMLLDEFAQVNERITHAT